MQEEIRYSIIIPARNGITYLPNCINTVINQNYKDYELIVSDNLSTDGTDHFLKTLVHPKVRKVIPPKSLSMVDHFEWALAQAKGEWLIFIGVDDGLMPYFFDLADKLTQIAKSESIRTIMSRRVYYFWSGCEKIYGDISVNYSFSKQIERRNTKLDLIRALIGTRHYFDLPQMYSNSLFHHSIIDEAKRKQGRVFSSLTPDANLASVACSLENRYLYSNIALGWVGTSPASNGFSHSIVNVESTDSVRSIERVNDFEKTNNGSELKFNKIAGNIKLAGCPLLLWEAILSSNKLRSSWMNTIVKSRLFIAILLARELYEMIQGKNISKVNNIKRIAETNNLNWGIVKYAFIITKQIRSFKKYGLINIIHDILNKIAFRLYRFFKLQKDDKECGFIHRIKDNITMETAGLEALQLYDDRLNTSGK